MSDLQILAIVSGKGGVGKTMLAVAIANELAQQNRTILFDLDFFNRGLTGLFASLISASPQQIVAPPAILAPDSSKTEERDSAWSLNEITKRLYVVGYGDLDKSQTDLLETMDVEHLAKELLRYIRGVAEQAQCDFAVLDCHGGPDNTSFAACLLANHSLLVSEPDRITLHGTLNFLRMLRQQSRGQAVDIRIIFNKVVADFTPIFLFRFYDRYLKSEFDGRELLAIYPLELYLTKAFEKVPLLTTVYPYSQLAIKSRLVLYELYKNTPTLANADRSNRNFLARTFRTYYMGRWPKVLETDFVLRVIGIYTVMVVALPWLAMSIFYRGRLTGLEQIYKAWGMPSNAMTVIAGALFLWLCATVTLSWTRDIDRFLLYSLRTGSRVMALIAWATLTLIWLVSGLVVGIGLYAFLFEPFDPSGMADLTGGVLLAISVGITAAFMALNLKRGLRAIRGDGRYLEGGLQIAFSAAVGLMVALAAILGKALLE